MMKNISFSREELTEIGKQLLGFQDLDITRISTIFIAQILQLYANRVMQISLIIDEIKVLEGMSFSTSTKKADYYKHLPLKGLMKKHFTSPLFITKNISSHLGLSHNGNKRLDSILKEFFEKHKSGIVDNNFIHLLSNELTCGVLEDRENNNQMTGEWIVYQEHENKKYYLTLAAHTETDDTIFKRVCVAYEQNFGFLRDSVK